jgi:hypothetical protein
MDGWRRTILGGVAHICRCKRGTAAAMGAGAACGTSLPHSVVTRNAEKGKDRRKEG